MQNAKCKIESPRFYILHFAFLCLKPRNSYFCPTTNRAIAVSFIEAEESPDSTEQYTGEEPGPAKAGTDSATENNRPALCGIRVKKWGKSPQWLLVTAATGKPCML